MTGAEKLAATLVGAIILFSALGASGQQPSNVTAHARRETGATPTSTAPRVPADMPPNPPKVTCDGDKLTISAQNSTLGAVLNAIRACTGAEIDVPEDARGERLFAELGPGPLRTVLADFLSSTDFNYVIKASPSDPQKVQMVLLNPRVSDSPGEVATVADGTTKMTPNRAGWLKARQNYMQSFTAAQDESNQQADAASPAPVEATAPAASSVPAEATAPAASSVPVEATAPAASSVPVEATATAASSVPAEANAPAASSVPAEATAPAPSSVPLEAAPVSPAPALSPVPSPAADPIASASTGSDTASGQGKTTQELISNMQRMFEQRKQMIQQQQQQTSASPP